MTFVSRVGVGLVTSGLAYGVLVVLLLRLLKKEAAQVEARFEAFRNRIGSNRIPVLETTHGLIRVVLRSIYGESLGRRFLASMIIGCLLALTVCLFSYLHYRSLDPDLDRTKARLEAQTSPALFDYRDGHPDIWQKAFEYNTYVVYVTVRDPQTGAMHVEAMPHSVPRYDGEPYEMIRSEVDAFDEHFLITISKDPRRTDLAILMLFEGTAFHPGMHLLDLALTCGFGLVIDFIAASIAIMIFSGHSRSSTVLGMLAAVASLGATTIVLLAACVSCFAMALRGDVAIFRQIVIAALGLIGVAGAIILPFTITRRQWFLGLAMAAVLGGAGILLLRSPVDAWLALGVSFPWPNESLIPYILGFGCLVPASLLLLIGVLAIALKLIGEQGRILTWAHMTWVKQHQGGTQLTGIVTVLALVTGVVIAMVTE